MSRCNPTLRWGAGTTKDKVVDTAATREMEQRLAAMRQSRDEIDKMWTQPLAKEQTPVIKTEIPKEEDKKYITFRSSN